MKYKILIILFFLINGTVNAQTPLYHWAKNFKCLTAKAIAVDDSENTYLCGTHRGTVDFDPGPGVFNLTAAIGENAYVSKFDALGNFKWAISFGDYYYDFANKLKVDKNGNIYISGGFYGTVDFDPDTTKSFKLTSNGDVDVFILKLDRNGKFIFAKNMGGLLPDNVTDLTIDKFSNIYTTGRTYGGDFDPGIPVNYIDGPVFISKLDKDGNFKWAKNITTKPVPKSMVFSNRIDVDMNGNVYTIGTFFGTADFDPSIDTQYVAAGIYGSSAYIHKLNSDGKLKWVKSYNSIYGGGFSHIAGSIKTDSNANVFAILPCLNIIDANPNAGVEILECKGNLFTKLDSVGNYVWGKTFGNGENTTDMILDSNSIYWGGTFRGNIELDPSADSFFLKTSNTYSDAYISKIDLDGNFKWAIQIGDTLNDGINGIALSRYKNLFTVGSFDGKVDFDHGPDSSFLNNIDGTVFLHKLSRCQSRNSLKKEACKSFAFESKVLSKTGIYNFLYRSKDNCDSIFSLDLKINTVSDSVIKSGSVISAYSSTATSYQWVKCPSYTPVAGATSATFTATTTGNYALIITENGCTDTSKCVSVFGLNIPNIQTDEVVHVYPNPSNGLFTISSAINNQEMVEIRSLEGKILQSRTINNKEFVIDLNAYSAGIYFLSIRNDNGIEIIKKLVKY